MVTSRSDKFKSPIINFIKFNNKNIFEVNNLKIKNTPSISSLINEKIVTSDKTQISNQLENKKTFLSFFKEINNIKSKTIKYLDSIILKNKKIH